jgi:hypothetical protein
MKTRDLVLWGVLALPLNSMHDWHELKFNGSTKSTVTADAVGLTVHVASSSSPIVLALEKPTLVESIEVAGQANALPKLPSDREEGSPGADDYALRVGLVYQGENSLSWWQLLFAPTWVKEMLKLHSDQKFEKVLFLALSQQFDPGRHRKHPKFMYVEEEVAQKVTGPGPFSFQTKLSETSPVFAVWIHADGDDTKSTFDTTIKSIKLNTKDAPN